MEIIKNNSLSNDQHLANDEVGRICSNMNDLKLAGNRNYSDDQPGLSASAGSSLSATCFRPKSVFDDPMLKEAIRMGSLRWEEDKFLHSATMEMDEEIQLLQNSIDDFSQDESRLLSAVKQFLSKYALVINSVFIKKGSVCLQKMIKKIKKTMYARTLTRILATEFYQLMIHPIARLVIVKCFKVFGPGPNLILYQQAMKYFLRLAKHELGALSLEMCIDTMRGEERMMLLKRITQNSLFLSTDPHGNYILQHVLGLRINTINHGIMLCLLDHFVSISQTKEGSCVTKKFMECYDFGLTVVVEELLDTPGAVDLLSRHPFGNYVVQKALVMTMNDTEYMDDYMALVEAIRPHFKELKYTVGRQLLNHIKDEFVGLNKQIPAY